MRKSICPYCRKIVDLQNHDCAKNNKKKIANEKRREYYQKNKDTLKPIMSKRWQKFRLHIIQRDGNKCLRCYYKFNKINSKELQVHHIRSRIHFPDLIFDEDNVITLCKTCNIQLGVSDKLDFKYEKQEEEYRL